MRQKLKRFASELRSQALAALIAVVSSACSWTGYVHDRLLDLTDIIDIEYGRGMALGVLVQATPYFEAGLGVGGTDSMRAWYGRRSASEDHEGAFVGFVFMTATGGYVHGTGPLSSAAVLGINMVGAGPVPPIDRLRFGGRIYLPFVQGGLYVNVGEIFDFVVGLASFDPAADDGIEKSALLDDGLGRQYKPPPMPPSEDNQPKPEPAAPPTPKPD